MKLELLCKMAHPFLTFIHSFIFILMTLEVYTQTSTQKDSEQLGMAIEYFQSGKYHEALLLFSQLNAKYKLNPRFKAYLGVCYFYEWEYKKACEQFEPILDELAILNPHERSIYTFCYAESCFILKEYNKAILQYETMLNLCYDNEKADVFYRLGLCYIQLEKWKAAYDCLQSSLAYYQRFGLVPEKKQRINQIRNMLNGCKEKI